MAVSFIGGGNQRKPSHKQTLSHNVVLGAPLHERALNLSGDRHWLLM